MATTISHAVTILSIGTSSDFIGLSSGSDQYSVIITERKTVTHYKISDRHNTHSFTLKADLCYSTPVVYDFEQNKFVGLISQLDKIKLCIWSPEQQDYADWEKTTFISEDIVQIICVREGEPLIVKADGSVVWLSHLNDQLQTISIIPTDIKNKKPRLEILQVNKVGQRIELVYRIEDCSTIYLAIFNSKQLCGQPTPMSNDSIIRCVSHCSTAPLYVGISETGQVVRWKEGQSTPQVIYILDKHLIPVDCYCFDDDQVLLACNNTTELQGVILIYSMKYQTVKILRKLSSMLKGPVFVSPPSYILTTLEDRLEMHFYKFSKLLLKNMVDSTVSMCSEPVSETTDSKLLSCMKALESLPENKNAAKTKLNEFDQKLLLGALKDMCLKTRKTWSHRTVLILLENLPLPSHVLNQVCEAAIRHNDSKTIEYIISRCADLSEVSITKLLRFILSNQKNKEISMDVDNLDEGNMEITDESASLIDMLLSKDITDVYASDALRSLELSDTVVLLRYLCALLSGDSNRCSILTYEQICQWCIALLDSHYTQLILSDQAELLVQLHENVSQRVDFQSHVLKMGATFAHQPLVSQVTAEPYSIEAVTFYS